MNIIKQLQAIEEKDRLMQKYSSFISTLVNIFYLLSFACIITWLGNGFNVALFSFEAILLFAVSVVLAFIFTVAFAIIISLIMALYVSHKVDKKYKKMEKEPQFHFDDEYELIDDDEL